MKSVFNSLFTSSVLIAFSAAVAAAPPASDSAADERESQNKQRDKQEFGAHDRPWAKDKLTAQDGAVIFDSNPSAPGLMQSKACVEEAVFGGPAASQRALSAAFVNTNAALTAIRDERVRLDDERRSIADMRALTEAASRRAQEELSALRQLRDEVAGLIDELEQREDANIARVVELVGNLSAKDAARILAENDARFVVQVLDAMDARVTAEIIGRMETDRAQEIIGLIASRGRPGQDDDGDRNL